MTDHTIRSGEDPAAGWSRATAILMLSYLVVVSVLPVALLPLHYGADAAFYLLTGDAYLYLGIAITSPPAFFSFDGETPTNGFHPLWQALIWAAARALGDAPLALMNIVAWSTVACVLGGVLLLGAAIRRASGTWLLAVLAAPGLYYLVVGQGLRNLAVWEFYSGMEAGLAFLLTGLIAWLIARFDVNEERPVLWLCLGTVMMLLMLTRLDEVFVPLAVGLAWLAWRPRQIVRRLPAVLLLGLPSAIALGLYWLYNWIHVGPLMPVSGAAKGEGAFLPNLYVTAVTFFSPLFDLRALLSDYDASRTVLAQAAFRVSEVVFPIATATIFVVILWLRFREAPWAALIAGLCIAIIIKGLYNLVFVNYWHQAGWYFAFACGALSFTGALLLAPTARRLRRDAPETAALLAGLVAMVGLLQASQAYSSRVEAAEIAQRREFWRAKASIEAALASRVPQPKLLEFGDGFLNFSFGFPVRHGFVYAGDPTSLRALRDSCLLRASFADGYNLLASYEYLRWPGVTGDESSDEVQAYLNRSLSDPRVRAELNFFDFEVVHVYRPRDLPFIALKPREAGAEETDC